MTEKRSSRIRKVHNYALLGDSDDEFFSDNDDKLPNLKKSNNKEEKSVNKCAEAKKITKDKSAKHPETAQVQREKSISKTISEAKQNSCIPYASHPEVLKSVNVSSPKASSRPIPSTPTYSNSLDNNVTTPFSSKVFFPVTPTSGLRLGLSRTKRLRPLHANIRIA